MKQLPFVLSITLVVLSFTASTAHAEQVEKMDLCHYDDLAQGWVLINITENAVAKHMENHDDGWPGDATGVTVTALNQACEQGGLPSCGMPSRATKGPKTTSGLVGRHQSWPTGYRGSLV